MISCESICFVNRLRCFIFVSELVFSLFIDTMCLLILGTTSNPNQFTGGVVLTPEQAEQIRYQKEVRCQLQHVYIGSLRYVLFLTVKALFLATFMVWVNPQLDLSLNNIT